MKNNIIFEILMVALIVSLSSCKPRVQDSQAQQTQPQAQQNPPAPETRQPGQAAQNVQPSTPSQPPAPAWDDERRCPAGVATITGKIYMGNHKPGKHGNMFVYVLDPKSLEADEPRALGSSQIILEDQITGDVVDFMLTNIPTERCGQRINVVWDTEKPYCDVTKPMCKMSVRDVVTESDWVELTPGGTVTGVEIMLPSTRY